MTKVAASIKRGLRQAVAFADGAADARAYRIHVPAKINLKAIRQRLDMTQQEFALRLQREHAAALGAGFTPARGASTRLSACHRTRA